MKATSSHLGSDIRCPTTGKTQKISHKATKPQRKGLAAKRHKTRKKDRECTPMNAKDRQTNRRLTQIDADGNRTSHRRSQSSRRKPANTVSTRSQLGQDHPRSAYIRGLPRRRPCEDGFICGLFLFRVYSRAFVVRFCAFCALGRRS